ncbi:MAG TPA: tRNA lysidine(34) synthetase TilS [Stellaceae bacterium]|nr:tRNA lysidine(34) synthetase TilS [Stellaceae bacterium]
MAPLGPFEPRPLLAVAVSGGADSMALALLAERWARARGGRIVALTVDHRLRPESTAEARQVRRWLRARGIAHRVLVWSGERPRSDLQAAARAARYRLLEEWCWECGCLHLLTAHHREDQAETFWLRLARGSGLDGLAGMAALSERASCRILRPLLPVAPERLRSLLRAQRQLWIEDPSNENPSFTRVRVRKARALLAAEGLGADRLGETMRHLGRARAALEAAAVGVMVHAVRIDPGGWAWLDPAILAKAPREIGLRVLAAVLATIGGTDYPPRLARIERLHDELLRDGLGGGRTLGGCRLVSRAGSVLVCREFVGAERALRLGPAGRALWDGRALISLPRKLPTAVRLDALGLAREGIPAAVRGRLTAVPAPARPSLPVLRDSSGEVVAVPAIAWAGREYGAALAEGATRFRPRRPLTPLGFAVPAA